MKYKTLYPISSTICFQMYIYKSVPFFEPMPIYTLLVRKENKYKAKDDLDKNFRLEAPGEVHLSLWCQSSKDLHDCKEVFYICTYVQTKWQASSSPLLSEPLHDLFFCISHQLNSCIFQLHKLRNRFDRRLTWQILSTGLLKELSSSQG